MKGVRKSVIGIIICTLLVTIAFSGCINDSNNKDKKIDTTIWIRNKSDFNISGNISLLDNGKHIYKSPFYLIINDYREDKLNLKEISYEIKIKTTNLTYSGNIKINSIKNHHYFDINNTNIMYIPTPTE